MLISDQKEFVFVHVPKTAGSSVTAALTPWALDRHTSRWSSLLRAVGLPRDYRRFRFPKHGALAEVERRMPAARFHAYFKFAFVRNPWERVVSDYVAVRDDPAHRRHARRRGQSFDAYLRDEAPRILASQHSLVTDAKGALALDFVGRFETLAEDFRSVCERLGIDAALPHLNGHDHAPYREFYDRAAREFVAEQWGSDVEAFGYEF